MRAAGGSEIEVACISPELELYEPGCGLPDSFFSLLTQGLEKSTHQDRLPPAGVPE